MKSTGSVSESEEIERRAQRIELADHEATGKLQRAHEAKLRPMVPGHLDEDFEQQVFGMHNVHDFELAVARSKFKAKPGEDAPHLLVSSELMEYLLRGAKDKSITYQNVRCYVAGSKDELDKQESMSSEKRADYLAYIGKTPEQIVQMKKEAQEAR